MRQSLSKITLKKGAIHCKGLGWPSTAVCYKNLNFFSNFSPCSKFQAAEYKNASNRRILYGRWLVCEEAALFFTYRSLKNAGTIIFCSEDGLSPICKRLRRPGIDPLGLESIPGLPKKVYKYRAGVSQAVRKSCAQQIFSSNKGISK